jgi:hypothetical protein
MRARHLNRHEAVADGFLLAVAGLARSMTAGASVSASGRKVIA